MEAEAHHKEDHLNDDDLHADPYHDEDGMWDDYDGGGGGGGGGGGEGGGEMAAYLTRRVELLETELADVKHELEYERQQNAALRTRSVFAVVRKSQGWI